MNNYRKTTTRPKVKTVPIPHTLEDLQAMSQERWYFFNLLQLNQWHKFIYGADHTENAKIQFCRKFMKEPK
jgi:hypothetical protein